MIKQLLMSAADSFGVFDRLASTKWRRKRLMILCYHGISLRDEHEWNPALYMSPQQFEGRLRYLREKRYAILALDDALARLHDGTLPPKSVSLTFDDGAHDFAQAAVPLLQKFDAPATVYLTTHYAQRRLPVFDTGLSYILWKGRAAQCDLAPVIDTSEPLRVASPVDRSRSWELIRSWTIQKGLDSQGKDALLRDIARQLEVNDELWNHQLLHIMSPEQVRNLPDSIAVELHTHRHRTPRDQQQFSVEIQQNREVIRELRPAVPPAVHFCYPSGDYSRHFLKWLAETGVRSATTCVPGLSTAKSPLLLLPRFVDTSSHSLTMFGAWVSGTADLLPRKREFTLDPQRN